MVDGSGHVVASADFNAPVRPFIPGCASLTPPTVRVAAGAAFFADSTGAIRRLDTTGAVTPVATFPLNANQFLSFGVSPDGQKLMAILFSTPPLLSPIPQFPADPYVSTGHWTLDLETALTGGSTTTVLHKDFGHTFPSTGPTLIAGWDDTGPVATLNSTVCVQNIVASVEYTGMPLLHLGSDGSHLDTIGGAGCIPLDELHDGTILCQATTGFSYTVRAHTGGVLWNPTTTSFVQEGKLSPNGYGVVVNGDKVQVFYRGSSQVGSITGQSGASVFALGWFGNDQIVAVEGFHIGLVPRTTPATFTDLGLPVLTGCNSCMVPVPVSLAGTIGA